MALKSGLLSETSWALDVLAVLLRDDTTVLWFGLQHLPGLVDLLLEHLRRCLIELFPGDFDDLEVLFETSSWKEDTITDSQLEVTGHERFQSSCALNSHVVHIEANSPDEELVSDDKRWDSYGDVDSSMLDWQMGRGDLTTHIQTRFNQLACLDFCSKRFFGPTKVSADRTARRTREVGQVHGVKREHLTPSPAENTTEQSSLSCAADVLEKSGCPSGAGTSDTARPLATGCRHGMCHAAQTSEDVDGSVDQNWLRLELKRLWSDEWEKQDNVDDETSASVLCVVGDDYQDTSSRCLALSNIVRGLSFVPGNDTELARHPGLVATLSRLLLYRHQHSRPDSKPIVSLEDVLVGRAGFEVAEVLRENALVTFANIAGQLELASYPEEICVPVLDGLLHWASCRAPCAVDPLPSATLVSAQRLALEAPSATLVVDPLPSATLVSAQRLALEAPSATLVVDPLPSATLVSAQRLALEALCKLCVTDTNVDLLLATPPFQRVVSILGNLVGAMANPDCDQVWREFAITFASSLVAGDPGVARALALHRCTIPVLVAFVEAAVADSSPSAAGTSADMVRRATTVLRAVAELPEGRSDLARNYQSRLLQLAVSPSLESTVLTTFAHILHICSSVPHPDSL